jgi:type IV secretory pathway VirJ component
MRKFFIIFFGSFFLGININAITTEKIVFGSFGNVSVYLPDSVPNAVVLFVSGDGGWNKGVVEMAKKIVTRGALVAGIDIQHYYKSLKTLKSKCYYPAGDFEELSLKIQKKYKFKQYIKPILVGYSSGATLVYGILAQAPANTFKGAISLGFCPDIEIDRTLCKGSGLSSHPIKEEKSYFIEPCKDLTAPFIVLQGLNDKVCSYDYTKKYMEDVPGGEIVSLAKVGHGFSVEKNWVPQFVIAYQKVVKDSGYVKKKNYQNKLLQTQHITPLNNHLPLTIIPTSSKENLPLAFFISGDGGWTSFDQTICEKLSEKGMPVVGLDAQEYFWNEKTPRTVSVDIESAIEYYLKQWNKNSFIVIGYSFGACVIPFIANDFSDALKAESKGIFCISPDETSDFEIHISDMLDINSDEKYNVLEELKRSNTLHSTCIFGSEEDSELIKRFSNVGLKVELLPGNHHFDNNFNAIAATILKNI